MVFDESCVNIAYLVLTLVSTAYPIIRDYLDRKRVMEIKTELNFAYEKIPPSMPPDHFLALKWEKISRDVWKQQKLRQRAAVGTGCLSVFRITQNGETVHLLTEGTGTMDMFHAAMRLWAYLLGKNSSTEPFAKALGFASSITPEMFQDYASEMQQNTARVITALDIDLDRGTLSTMAGADGWQTYAIRDVCMMPWHTDSESNHD